MSLKPTRHSLVRDWKQDVVYIVQFPRLRVIPSASPFSLKVETFVRFNKLNYVNVDNEFKHASSKCQVPFIELNGRHFADSSFIIENLITIFNLPIDRHLNTHERADARALTLLVEESLCRAVQYDRSRNFKWMMSAEQGLLDNLTGVKRTIVPKVVPLLFQRKLKSLLQAQGIGRNTPSEVDEIFKRDLVTLSTFLGDKPFFFGDRPSSFDATAFSHLAQVYYTPLNSSVVKFFMEQSTPNLVEFLRRVRAEYWPDWEEIGAGLLLNPGDAPKPLGGHTSHGHAHAAH
ncbi:failed axon connections protein [Aphelenchoides avenae]|nr:failed axon connections protein [Aphelenchus avenae]